MWEDTIGYDEVRGRKTAVDINQHCVDLQE
jgi:hypothetical protein